MHLDQIEPDLIVDVKNIAEMREVVEQDGSWRFGAAVTGKELMDNPEFNVAWPGCHGWCAIDWISSSARTGNRRR